jgi:predicted nucleotidyltransferase
MTSSQPSLKKQASSTAGLIRRMVSRIVKRFGPDKIILFGSQARGDAKPDSDVDLLIVMPVSGSKRRKAVEIGVALHDFRIPKDVIVVTPEEFEWRKDTLGTVEWPAWREGKVLYARG